MALCIFISLIYVYYKNTKHLDIAVIFAIGMVYLSRMVFVARAQEISFLIFIWEFYFIEKLVKTGEKKYSVFLVILGILLANFHSSVYPVLFIIYLPYLALLIIQEIYSKRCTEKEFFEIKNKNVFLMTFIISLFTGLCSSAGTAPYTDMFKAMNGVSKTFIGELAKSTWSNNKVFYAGIIIALVCSVFCRKKLKLTDMFYILGFGAMAIYTYRCTYFFWLIAGISLNRILSNFIEKAEMINKNFVKVPIIIAISFVYVVLAVNSFLWIQRQEYVEKDSYPVGVSNYIIENLELDEIRLFNHFNYGSYLEFRGIKTFIDSRSGMFTNEFNPGCTILDDWLKIYNDSSKYQEVFEKYNINYAVVETKDKLYEKINENSNWKISYTDDNFTLFERNVEE